MVTGANGSGKSTLLKALVGLEEPSEGSIKISGKIGYSALDLAVYPALTAAEHLELTADLRGCPANTEEWLERVGLTRSRNQLAQEFSTGMRARLKLAIARQDNPDVLILDEPGAGLDQVGRQIIEETVQEHLRNGAVIIATNDPAEQRFATHQLEVKN